MAEMDPHSRLSRIGPYLLSDVLGVGSFGKVKVAIHAETGARFACKVVSKSLIKEHTLSLQIQKEVAIMRKLRHPNTVSLITVYSTSSKIFIIMELVDGGELLTEIRRTARMSEPYARFYFRQLIEGLQYCHSHGVYHRDLKPENILITRDRTLKITDFGLSFLKGYSKTESDLVTGSIILNTKCGTPCYVAPEVITPGPYSAARVDIWACGIVLFAMCSGGLPFESNNERLLFKLILMGSIDFPPYFSEDLKDLIRNLLKTKPSERFNFASIRQHRWFTAPAEDHMPGEVPVSMLNLSDNSRNSSPNPHSESPAPATTLPDLPLPTQCNLATNAPPLPSSTLPSIDNSDPSADEQLRSTDSLDRNIHANIVRSEVILAGTVGLDLEEALQFDSDYLDIQNESLYTSTTGETTTSETTTCSTMTEVDSHYEHDSDDASESDSTSENVQDVSLNITSSFTPDALPAVVLDTLLPSGNPSVPPPVRPPRVRKSGRSVNFSTEAPQVFPLTEPAHEPPPTLKQTQTAVEANSPALRPPMAQVQQKPHDETSTMHGNVDEPTVTAMSSSCGDRPVSKTPSASSHTRAKHKNGSTWSEAHRKPSGFWRDEVKYPDGYSASSDEDYEDAEELRDLRGFVPTALQSTSKIMGIDSRTGMRRVHSLEEMKKETESSALPENSNTDFEHEYSTEPHQPRHAVEVQRQLWDRDAVSWRAPSRSYHLGCAPTDVVAESVLRMKKMADEVNQIFSSKKMLKIDNHNVTGSIRKSSSYAAVTALKDGGVVYSASAVRGVTLAKSKNTSSSNKLVRSQSHDGSMTVRTVRKRVHDVARQKSAVPRHSSTKNATGSSNSSEGSTSDNPPERHLDPPRRDTSAEQEGRDGRRPRQVVVRVAHPEKDKRYQDDRDWVRTETDRMIWCMVLKDYNAIPDEVEFGLTSVELHEGWTAKLAEENLGHANSFSKRLVNAYRYPRPSHDSSRSRGHASPKRSNAVGRSPICSPLQARKGGPTKRDHSSSSTKAGVSGYGPGLVVTNGRTTPTNRIASPHKGNDEKRTNNGVVGYDSRAVTPSRDCQHTGEVTQIQLHNVSALGEEHCDFMDAKLERGRMVQKGKDSARNSDVGSTTRDNVEEAIVPSNGHATTATNGVGIHTEAPYRRHSSSASSRGTVCAAPDREEGEAGKATMLNGMLGSEDGSSSHQGHVSSRKRMVIKRNGSENNDSIGARGDDHRRVADATMSGVMSTRGSSPSVPMEVGAPLVPRKSAISITATLSSLGDTEELSSCRESGAGSSATPDLGVSTNTREDFRVSEDRHDGRRVEPASGAVDRAILGDPIVAGDLGEAMAVDHTDAPFLPHTTSHDLFRLYIPSPKGSRPPSSNVFIRLPRIVLLMFRKRFSRAVPGTLKERPEFQSLLRPSECFQVMREVVLNCGCSVLAEKSKRGGKYEMTCESKGRARPMQVTILMKSVGYDGFSSIHFTRRAKLRLHTDDDEFSSFYFRIMNIFCKKTI